MKKRVNVAICGFGGGAAYFHIPLLQKDRHLNLVAVFDVTEQRRLEALALGVEFVSDPANLTEAITQLKIDIVVICSPSACHAPQCIQAIDAGASVILEKPAATSLAEFRNLVKSASNKGRFVLPFHNRQFDNDHLKVLEHISSGYIGSILRVELTQAQWGPSEAFATPEFFPTWRRMKAWGGGMLNDWGPHLFDQLLRIFDGKQPISVSAIGGPCLWSFDAEDFVDAHFVWDGGIFCRVMISAIDSENQSRVRVVGSSGSITVFGTEERGEVRLISRGCTDVYSYLNTPFCAQRIYDVARIAVSTGDYSEIDRLCQQAEGVYNLIDKVSKGVSRPKVVESKTRSGSLEKQSIAKLVIREVDDLAVFDELVTSSDSATLFHSSSWLNHSTFDFHRIGAFAGDMLVAGMVIQKERAPFGCLGTISPYLGPFIRSSGKICLTDDVSQRAVFSLSKYVLENIASSCFFTSPYLPDVSAVLQANFRASVQYTRTIDIKNLEQTWAALSPMLRRNIKAAERAGYSVQKGTLESVIRMSQRSFERQGTRIWYSLDEVQSCLSFLQGAKKSAVFETKSSCGEVAAAICIVWDNFRAYYILGGYEHDASHRGATSLALWRALHFLNRELGIGCLDLEGSSVPGIARFFDQWTRTKLPFFFVQPAKTNLPWRE